MKFRPGQVPGCTASRQGIEHRTDQSGGEADVNRIPDRGAKVREMGGRNGSVVQIRQQVLLIWLCVLIHLAACCGRERPNTSQNT